MSQGSRHSNGEFAPRVGHTALTWGRDGLDAAIRDVAELGYQGIEILGPVYDSWNQKAEGSVVSLLRQHRLPLACLDLIGDFTDPAQVGSLRERGARWAGDVAALSQGGGALLIVADNRKPDRAYTRDDYVRAAGVMDDVGRRALAEGVVATLHPHWGTWIESREEIDLMMQLSDPAALFFGPDTGQIAKGGADPVGVVHDHVDRVRHVHLKDLSREWTEMQARGATLPSPEGYVELGEGLVDNVTIVDLLRRRRGGFDGWIMVELDRAQRPAREAAEISLRYVRGRLCLLV